MKDLYIVRHGKSSWNLEGISDIDRPLKERGINDGYRMADRLLKQNKVPEMIVSSPANRALHTATIFARTFNFLYSDIIINDGIYHADANLVLSIIKQTEDSINSLMIFGHNPTFTDLSNFFVNNKIDNVPTTGIVGLRFETNTWKELDKLKPNDWFFDFPKKLI